MRVVGRDVVIMGFLLLGETLRLMEKNCINSGPQGINEQAWYLTVNPALKHDLQVKVLTEAA